MRGYIKEKGGSKNPIGARPPVYVRVRGRPRVRARDAKLRVSTRGLSPWRKSAKSLGIGLLYFLGGPLFRLSPSLPDRPKLAK